MRGPEPGQLVRFSYVALEKRIPADHPLRALKALVEPVLTEPAALSGRQALLPLRAGIAGPIGRTSPAVASTHQYGLTDSRRLSASRRLLSRRSQMHRWHNAGLPKQARDARGGSQ